MIEAQSYEELGRKLRHARLDRKMELEQAAAAIHIRARYLYALEDGALDQLPGDPYVQGYYAQYAKLLELPADEVVSAYKQIGALPQRRLFYIPESIRREQHPSPILVMLTGAIAVGIMAWWLGESSPPVVMEPTVQTTRKIEPVLRAPGCRQDYVVWPPCYQEQPVFYSPFLPTAPINTVMEITS